MIAPMRKLFCRWTLPWKGVFSDATASHGCLEDCYSPLASRPPLIKRLLRSSFLGDEMAVALGRMGSHEASRSAALELARRGASGWHEGAGRASRTNLQVAVSMGWCDVAEVLLQNDSQRLGKTTWGKRLWTQHLASLWWCVDNEDAESFVRRHMPLEYWVAQFKPPHSSLYRLATALGERGLLRSFEVLYHNLPPLLQEALVQNVDLGRWSMDGMIFVARFNPWILRRKDDERRPLSHFFALSVEGQQLLGQLSLSPGLDVDGNSALLTWCANAYCWKPGVVSRASYGNPQNCLRYLPDTPQNAIATLEGLLALGVDPWHRNLRGKSVLEQALEEDGAELWMGLRQQCVRDRQWRYELLKSRMQSQVISDATPLTNRCTASPRL